MKAVCLGGKDIFLVYFADSVCWLALRMQSKLLQPGLFFADFSIRKVRRTARCFSARSLPSRCIYFHVALPNSRPFCSVHYSIHLCPSVSLCPSALLSRAIRSGSIHHLSTLPWDGAVEEGKKERKAGGDRSSFPTHLHTFTAPPAVSNDCKLFSLHLFVACCWLHSPFSLGASVHVSARVKFQSEQALVWCQSHFLNFESATFVLQHWA